jgi:Fic family protein
LLQKKYVVDKIILPALSQALERKYITDTEYIILKYIVQAREMTIKSEELEKVLWIKDSVKKSRYMNKLKEKNMIKPITDNGRIYTIHFTNNYLLRSIIAMLDKQWFVADFLNK